MKKESRKQIKQARKEILNSASRRTKRTLEIERLLRDLEKSKTGYIPVTAAELNVLIRLSEIDIRGGRLVTSEGISYFAFLAPDSEK